MLLVKYLGRKAGGGNELLSPHQVTVFDSVKGQTIPCKYCHSTASPTARNQMLKHSTYSNTKTQTFASHLPRVDQESQIWEQIPTLEEWRKFYRRGRIYIGVP